MGDQRFNSGGYGRHLRHGSDIYQAISFFESHNRTDPLRQPHLEGRFAVWAVREPPIQMRPPCGSAPFLLKNMGFQHTIAPLQGTDKRGFFDYPIPNRDD
jgi:hypothetical protein